MNVDTIETSGSLEAPLQAVGLARYGQISAVAFIVYDFGLTFNRERATMWCKPLNSGKLLFFVMRYFTVFFSISVAAVSLSNPASVTVGTFTQRLPWIGSIIITVLAELVLQLRIYALYKGSRIIVVVILLSFMMTFAPMIVIGALIIQNETGKIVLEALPSIGSFGNAVCVASDTTHDYDGFWVPTIVNEAFLCCLAAYIWLRAIRDRGTMGGFASHFTLFIVRGSIKYFLVIFAVLISSEVLWLSGGSQYIPFAMALAGPIASVMSQRLLLELREKYMKSVNSSPLSQLRFGIAHPTVNTVGIVTQDSQASTEADWLISFSE